MPPVTSLILHLDKAGLKNVLFSRCLILRIGFSVLVGGKGIPSTPPLIVDNRARHSW